MCGHFKNEAHIAGLTYCIPQKFKILKENKYENEFFG